jgi:hypothetical protein
MAAVETVVLVASQGVTEFRVQLLVSYLVDNRVHVILSASAW